MSKNLVYLTFWAKRKSLILCRLFCCFFTEDGTRLEIGTGYDLWRWHEAASRFGGKSEIFLKGTDDGILFERKICFEEADFCIGRTNFRFSWYFAWDYAGDVSDAVTLPQVDGESISQFDKVLPNERKSYNLLTPSGKKLVSNGPSDRHVYCLDNMSWPTPAIVEGKRAKCPCFCSRQTCNYMKSWFRSLYNRTKNQKTDIYLCDIDIHVCLNASHMVRGKRKRLVHWDLIYLLSFWEWANKYLSEADNHFYIVFDKNSTFAELPSIKGLSSEF